ncbi:hypothetical protein [Vibrio scophthalmi]|uniref:NodB homology domain-containing protein n=1 Tax=Vibrio scophthalmi TaxID=45658 RepID=A0A1E3WL90_9VIBR|nr:hypothetical protein [Vibrio scophthalmi]ODS09752.1 hypothetical protein VSF3289_03214 [Vibrio scophthalmi]
MWPNNKNFAFTIFDDTDNSTIGNTKVVYDYLIEKGLLTSKSVWVWKPRGGFKGDTLSDEGYLKWVNDLKEQGVEICLHNIGDGLFSRNEIEKGLEKFEIDIGYPPLIHCNHSGNKDSLYWWSNRFEFPFSLIYKALFFLKRKQMHPRGGEHPESEYFWGDIAKEKIKYVRNFTFDDVNTIKIDPMMPYHDGGYSKGKNKICKKLYF